MNKHLMSSSSVWHHAVPGLVIASLLLASCAPEPTESRITADTIGLSGHDPAQIIRHRDLARTLMTQPLADAGGRISASIAALLVDDSRRQMFGFFVACALPEDAVLVGTVGDFGDIEFFGGHGLAPQWRTGPLNLDGQRWVSACLFAKLNEEQLHIGLSLRGPHLGLALLDGESEAFPLEEAAFYGNMFVPLNQDLQWYTCRGRDLAAGARGDLDNRDCSVPDPNKPGLTKCGLTWTGDCLFAAQRACESFVTNGTYYRRCHTAPSQNGQLQGALFEQVITVFVQD